MRLAESVILQTHLCALDVENSGCNFIVACIPVTFLYAALIVAVVVFLPDHMPDVC
jgi:hypothetical protein